MVREWMHSWKQSSDMWALVSLPQWAPVEEAGQAEGVQVLVFVPPTPCVTSTKTLPTLGYFHVGAGS